MSAASRRWLINLRRQPLDELSQVVERDPVKVFRNARSLGWSVSEASNLAAYFSGLPIHAGDHGMKPWTMKSVLRLNFYRWLYRRGEWS